MLGLPSGKDSPTIVNELFPAPEVQRLPFLKSVRWVYESTARQAARDLSSSQDGSSSTKKSKYGCKPPDTLPRCCSNCISDNVPCIAVRDSSCCVCCIVFGLDCHGVSPTMSIDDPQGMQSKSLICFELFNRWSVPVPLAASTPDGVDVNLTAQPESPLSVLLLRKCRRSRTQDPQTKLARGSKRSDQKLVSRSELRASPPPQRSIERHRDPSATQLQPGLTEQTRDSPKNAQSTTPVSSSSYEFFTCILIMNLQSLDTKRVGHRTLTKATDRSGDRGDAPPPSISTKRQGTELVGDGPAAKRLKAKVSEVSVTVPSPSSSPHNNVQHTRQTAAEPPKLAPVSSTDLASQQSLTPSGRPEAKSSAAGKSQGQTSASVTLASSCKAEGEGDDGILVDGVLYPFAVCFVSSQHPECEFLLPFLDRMVLRSVTAVNDLQSFANIEEKDMPETDTPLRRF